MMQKLPSKIAPTGDVTHQQSLADLYHRAFAEFGARALLNMVELEQPTPATALIVARRLRVEGNLEARQLAEDIEAMANAHR